MSKEARISTNQGIVTSYKSTREVALDAALRLPQASPLSYGEGIDGLKDYATVLVGYASIIEEYLDREEPRTGEADSTEGVIRIFIDADETDGAAMAKLIQALKDRNLALFPK